MVLHHVLVNVIKLQCNMHTYSITITLHYMFIVKTEKGLFIIEKINVKNINFQTHPIHFLFKLTPLKYIEISINNPCFKGPTFLLFVFLLRFLGTFIVFFPDTVLKYNFRLKMGFNAAFVNEECSLSFSKINKDIFVFEDCIYSIDYVFIECLNL